jgi:ATP-dependent exoDNAse (exonuclease V) alpha subunit
MTLIVVDDTDSERYEKFKSESSMAIKNFSKHMLNQYRTSPKQIEKFIIKPLWKQWNKIFVEPFANVNYGYSITCHKAQGSSFYDVYVDLDDILLNSQRPVEAKKCAYTAATRTSNELNVLV